MCIPDVNYRNDVGDSQNQFNFKICPNVFEKAISEKIGSVMESFSKRTVILYRGYSGEIKTKKDNG